MKKHLTAVITVVMLAVMFMSTPIVSFASSLDEVINEQSSDDSNNENNSGNNEQQSQTTQPQQPVQQTQTDTNQYLNDLSQATSLNVDFKGTSNAQAAIKKVASIIVQVLSYFLVAFLVVRIVIDLIYIALPFTRSFLANGYGGNAAAGGGGMGMQQPGMGGMGMGAGMGGMGMGRMGMGGMGGMGMNRMGMGGMQGGMQGGQMGATPAMGRVQWVSNAALNAVASESMPGPDGKPQSALKYYAKDMTVVLVITPILLTLAITGTLTNLGFLLGDLISKGITNFSHSL